MVEVRGTIRAHGYSNKEISTRLSLKHRMHQLCHPDKKRCLGGNSPLPLLKGPKPTFTLPLLPSCSAVPHLDITPSPRPGLHQSILLSAALTFTANEKGISAEDPRGPTGDFPRSCRGPRHDLCQQGGWSSSLLQVPAGRPLQEKLTSWLTRAKAGSLDLANTPRALHQIWACALASSLSHCMLWFWSCFLHCREFFKPC